MRCTDLFDDKSSLVKFTKRFGPELWDKAVIILTKANALQALCEEAADDNLDVEKAFCDRISTWKKQIRKHLTKLGAEERK